MISVLVRCAREERLSEEEKKKKKKKKKMEVAWKLVGSWKKRNAKTEI